MGKKNRKQFVKEVFKLAIERDITLGIMVFEDEDGSFGFSNYEDTEEAENSLKVLMNLLTDLREKDETS